MMTLVRVLSVLIVLVGLVELFVGIGGFSIVDSSVSIIEQMRESGSATMDGIDLSRMRVVLYATYALTTLIGLLSAVSGVGMFFKKNWARLLWLITLVLMLAWNAYTLVVRTINVGHGFENTLSIGLGMFVIAALMYFFCRPEMRKIFEVT